MAASASILRILRWLLNRLILSNLYTERFSFLLKPEHGAQGSRTVPQPGVDDGAGTTENLEVQKYPHALQFGHGQDAEERCFYRQQQSSGIFLCSALPMN